MTLQVKAGWCDVVQLTWAPRDLEHASAGAATKVVVVCTAGFLVPSGLAGQLYWYQPSTVDQRIDRPIDGGDTESCNMIPAGLKHLRWPERPWILPEDLPDGIPLLSVALHALKYAAWHM